MKTLKDLFNKSVEENRNNIASYDIDRNGNKEEFSYLKYSKEANNLTQYLIQKLKIKKGDRVALYSENRSLWMIAYFGIVNSGAIVVPIDAKYGSNELNYILGHCSAKGIIVSSNLLDNVIEADFTFRQLDFVISFDKVVVEDKKILSWDEIRNFSYSNEKEVEITEDDIAEIIYTSGTTGVAKGVMLSHKNLVRNVEMINEIKLIEKNDKMLAILPLHHTYQSTAGALVPFSNGTIVYYLLYLTPTLMIRMIEKEKINKMIVVPLVLQKIYNNIEREISRKKFIKYFIWSLKKVGDIVFHISKDYGIYKKLFKFLRKKAGLASIDFFVSGAAPLQDYVFDGLMKYGIEVLQGYGLTEASPVVSVNLPGKIKRKSVGPLLPGIEVKIVGELAKEDGYAEGEIVIKGDNVMVGYYKNEEETNNVLIDGWLYTGDIGYVDKDGFLYITGREKNIIVTSGGKNIFPEEIEQKFMEYKEISEVIIIGKKVSEHDKGEVPFAFIVPNLDEIDYKYGKINQTQIEKIIDDIVKEVNKQLIDYKKIKDFKIIYDELPKTSTQKVKRYMLKEMIE